MIAIVVALAAAGAYLALRPAVREPAMSVRTAALAVLAAAITGLVWLGVRCARPAPSEADRIRAAFEEAAVAASEKRPGDVMKLVSERFSGAGMEKREVHQLVVAETLRAAWAQASVAGLEVLVEGERARANVDVVLTGSTGKGKGLPDLLPDEARAYRFRCTLAREDGDWRVVSAEWSPITFAEALEGPPEVQAEPAR